MDNRLTDTKQFVAHKTEGRRHMAYDEERDNVFNRDPFSVKFNMLKIRYAELDESLGQLNAISTDDKINVFFNLETVFKHISMIQDLSAKITICEDIELILISNIMNLIAHYKHFFTNAGLDTRFYLYQTDFDSTEYYQWKYNEFFRSYYTCKYNNNPKIVDFTRVMKEGVYQNVKTLCDFIPNVYYITGKNIDGSLIPYIIALQDPTRININFSGEWFDTQYTLLPGFINYFIVRNFNIRRVLNNVTDYVRMKGSFRKTESVDEFVPLYSIYPFYVAMLSLYGDKARSIDPIRGYGAKQFHRALSAAIRFQRITSTTSSPDILATVLEQDDREEFIDNYYCINVLEMYKELTDADIKSVINQIIDRVDIKGLQDANNLKFDTHPILVDALLN